MPAQKLLVVDDEAKMQDILKTAFEDIAYIVDTASNVSEALKKFKEDAADIVITDMKMPRASGLELVRSIKKISPKTPVIILTAYGTVASAVDAMKEGAYHYILKPVNLDELKIVVERALSENRLTKELEKVKEELRERYGVKGLVGKSACMKNIFETIHLVADTLSPVLITGESGTGKELVARSIHYTSKCAEGPFFAINCAALPETLLESELFGYMKGAFTDATKDKPGYFELAEGGTLFLDEIGDMSVNLQAKLLRVIEEKQFLPLGGTKPIQTNVRVIAATHQDLSLHMKDGKFREDLYYRLNVVSLHLPPLRERRDDLPLLFSHFLYKYNAQYKKNISLSQNALKLLVDYAFPGNVRELENIVERMVIFAKSETLQSEDVPQEVKEQREKLPFEKELLQLPFNDAREKLLSSFEKKYFMEVLKKVEGNVSHAAKHAQMHRRQLQRKLKEYGMGDSEDKEE